MLKNISWLAAGNVLVKPIWFVFITFVCIRYLGIVQYGTMTAALALMSICDGSLTLGTTSYSIREIARAKAQSSVFFSNFLVLRLALSITAIAIGLLVNIWIGGAMGSNTILFAGLYVLSRNLTDYCRSIFRGHEEFRYDAWSTILEKVLVVLTGSLALVRWPTVNAVFLGMTLGMVGTFLFNFSWVSSRFAKFGSAFLSKSFLKSSMPKAIPLGLSSIFVLLLYRTDSIMLESMQGELATGQYGIAFRVTEATLMVPALLTAVLLPRLSELFTSDFQGFWRTSKRGLLGIVIASSIITAAIFATAPVIVHLIDSSPAAEPASFLLKILIWSFPLSALNYVLSSIFTASNLQNRLAWILGFAAVLNIGLNLYLIPLYSSSGAATATIITQALIGLSLGASVLFWRISDPKKQQTD